MINISIGFIISGGDNYNVAVGDKYKAKLYPTLSTINNEPDTNRYIKHLPGFTIFPNGSPKGI